MLLLVNEYVYTCEVLFMSDEFFTLGTIHEFILTPYFVLFDWVLGSSGSQVVEPRCSGLVKSRSDCDTWEWHIIGCLWSVKNKWSDMTTLVVLCLISKLFFELDKLGIKGLDKNLNFCLTLNYKTTFCHPHKLSKIAR
jgi:hypothetical protein